MLFHELAFLVFLPLFVFAYFITRGRLRTLVCLSGSYIFYGWWDWRFLGLIAGSTLVDYFVGLKLADASPKASRRWVLASIVANLGTLGLFKYYNFFASSFAELISRLGWQPSSVTLEIILPVGISFYTFQTLSYSIDVYRKHIEPERSLLHFATFVAFFPQLVAGPIVRASEFLPQLHVDHRFEPTRVNSGLSRMFLGFYKKLVVADGLAAFVDHSFASPEAVGSLGLLVAIVFYAFQIYCDFSGYSDIAIGTARILGIDFAENFKHPYFSRSFSDFWGRWHISLSSWLRDYLYIPLGGNRFGRARMYRNLMVTMLLGGLWHGANWTFVVWGALHGSFLVAQRVIGRPLGAALERARVPSTLLATSQVTLVFFLTCVAWIFFRAQSIGLAGAMIGKVASLDGFSFAALSNKFVVLRGCLLVGSVLAIDGLQEWGGGWVRHRSVRFAACVASVWAIALLGTFRGEQFIYFQF